MVWWEAGKCGKGVERVWKTREDVLENWITRQVPKV